MTSFDPKGGERDAEDWQALAFRNASENNNQLKFIGGAILAGIATAAVSPLTGALVAGYCVYSCIKDLHDKGRNRMAVRNYGMVAPFLGEREFNDYARQVVAENGQEKLLEELIFADENGFELSESAYQFIETNASHLIQESTQPRQLLASSVPVIATQSSFTGEPDLTIDIVKAIASPVQNCLIFGIGGSGKGMLVANALRRIKADNPNRKIFYIDPKADEKEFGYLDGVVDEVARKKCKNRPPEEIIEWMLKTLDEYKLWRQNVEESLLVIDEGSTLGDAAKKCKNNTIGTMVLHIASMGDVDKEKVWILAQSPFVEPLGMTLAQTSQLVSACIVGDKNTNVIKQWSRSPIMGTIKQPELDELLRACPIPQNKRAIYWGGTSKWYAMPVLENYSSYNRDEDKPAGDSLTSDQRTSLRSRTTTTVNDKPQSLPKLSVADMIKKIESTQAISLEQFITYDLSALSHMAKLKPAIVKIIRERVELLEKFGLKWLSIDDPIEAMIVWGAGNKSDDELKEAWLLHTEKELNDEGVKLLRGKLR